MCCERLRQSSSCKNSDAKGQEGLSTWMFTSPRITMLGDVVQSDVRRSCISEMKPEFGFSLGGR